MTAPLAFRYTAVRADGATEAGVIHAEHRDIVTLDLARRGLLAVEIQLHATEVADGRQIPLGQLALGLRLLAQLLAAGLPMNRALSAFTEAAPMAWARILPGIRGAIQQGRSLAAALHATASVPDVVVGIVEAGEAGSGLADAVGRAAAVVEETERTRTAIRGALAYPFILAVAATASLGLLVGVVLPRFAALLADLGQELPATTRLVLAAGAGVRSGAVPLLLLGAAGGIVVHTFLRQDRHRERWSLLLRRIPVLGPIRTHLATSRACETLGALLSCGVPVARALARATRACGDHAMAAAILRAREAVIGGSALSRALEAQLALTPMAVRLLRTGEEAGNVGGMLNEAARIERAAAERATKTALRFLEPALILAFGVVVAFSAAALLQALYGIRPT
jgi:general secretion pathway protein F